MGVTIRLNSSLSIRRANISKGDNLGVVPNHVGELGSTDKGVTYLSEFYEARRE